MSAAFEPGEQWDEQRIVCPYCGNSRKADPCDGDASKDPEEEQCGECGKEFIRSAWIEITYHTKPKREQ